MLSRQTAPRQKATGRRRQLVVATRLFEIVCKRAGGAIELERVGHWINAQNLARPGLLNMAKGRPLRLRLIRAILQAADDPDRDFLLQAEDWLTVGIRHL